MIQVENITKLYQDKKARDSAPAEQAARGIRNITFQVAQGEVFGFLGPNGAGKTTMIRLLMGFIKADSGSARIKGLDCWKNSVAVKKLVGYLPGEMNFFDQMSGREFLDLMVGMHGDRPLHRKRRDALVSRLELKLEQPIRKMSKGMKQKLGIICALMTDGEVLILDEPTSGLDPVMQKIFIDLVLEEKSRGKTVFISSHMFSEVERTCDRVGIICNGQLAAVESIYDLRQMQNHTLEITLEDEEDIRFLTDQGIKIKDRRGMHLTVQVQGNFHPLLAALAQVKVKDFAPRATGLEEAFMHLYLEEGKF